MKGMFDPPGDDELADAPPPNQAMEYYRLLIWLMPTCVAITTLVGCVPVRFWLSLATGQALLLWLAVNLAATIVLGIFHAKLKLSSPNEGEVAPRLDPVDVVTFVVIQVFLVPFLTYVMSIFLMVAGVFK